MDFFEKKIDSDYKFSGKIMKTRVDTVLLPNGKTATREVCEHVDGVGILPIDDDGNVYLVRQFRYPYGIEMLEIPAGKMEQDEGETHLECGIRELEEETGFTADKMIYLGEVYPSPGFLTEVLYLYAAKGLQKGEMHPDEDEFVETVKIPMEELCEKIADGEICDGKTIAAVLKAKLFDL